MNDRHKRHLLVIWPLVIACLALSLSGLLRSRPDYRPQLDELQSRLDKLKADYEKLSEQLSKTPPDRRSEKTAAGSKPMN